MNKKLLAELKFDENGLIPAIAQDIDSGEIRMLAYMNEESLEKTLASGYVHYYSRSRQQLWKKGESSGNLQEFVEMRLDCDADTLLVFIRQHGGACHTGKRNCFYRRINPATGAIEEVDPRRPGGLGSIVSELEEVIATRDQQRPEGSYTTRLLAGSADKSAEDTVLEKLGEEMTELILAAKNNSNERLAEEAGDLIYHLLVLFRQKKLPISSLATVLEDRRG